MNSKIIIGVLILIVLVAGGLLILSTGQSSVTGVQAMPSSNSNEGEVTITQSGFSPETVTIKVGTKVVWTNKSGQTATVNSDVHPTHLLYPPLNLGEVADGQSVALVFDKPGTYGYHNHLNPSERGTIMVRK